MNFAIVSSPLKKGLQVALSLLLGVALLGSSAAYAFGGLCVHPTGAGNCFTSIQAAVDAANDGDQILIRSGKYVEQITIVGKSLTLVGRRGAVIQAPEAMEDTLSPIAFVEGRPIILVTEANVTIRDLVVDGANSGASNPFMFGILLINADGVIRGNVVKDVGFGTPTFPPDYSYQGEGITAVNFGETPRTVTIAENYVVNYNTIGIDVFTQTFPGAPAPASLTAYVVNNTVVGSGPTDAIDQWGIFFGAYAPEDNPVPEMTAQMTGAVKGNRIRDLVSVEPYPLPGVGIHTKDLINVEIANNVIENVNMGLKLSGQYTQIVENRFKKMDTGILLVVEPPAEFVPLVGGSVIGVGLEDNRFENVYLDLMTTSPEMFEMPVAMTMSETASEPLQPRRLPR
jgi:hypothetical protein